MSVAIRLKRIGKKLNPVYRVVAIDSRRRAQGKPIEELGFYNPRNKKEISLNAERLNYWIKTGAVVSSTVKGLIKKNVQPENKI